MRIPLKQCFLSLCQRHTVVKSSFSGKSSSESLKKKLLGFLVEARSHSWYDSVFVHAFAVVVAGYRVSAKGMESSLGAKRELNCQEKSALMQFILNDLSKVHFGKFNFQLSVLYFSREKKSKCLGNENI